MAKYTLDYCTRQTIVDTAKSKASYTEATDWNGNNHISRATGSQWEHETLYLSSRDHYYIVRTSQWQGSSDSARLVSAREAAMWMIMNEHPLPEALAKFEDEVME
jgi:hypothetical protein